MLHDPSFHYQRFLDVTKRIEQQGNILSQLRDAHVVLAMTNREKVNWLAFAIVGAALTISPHTLNSYWTIFGAGLMLGNALFFGYIADTQQININITNMTKQLTDMQTKYSPYADAYDAYSRNINATTEARVIETYIRYLDESNRQQPTMARRTKLSIGNWYFVLFVLGFIIFCYGIASTANNEKPTNTIVEGSVELRQAIIDYGKQK